jgi:SLIDE
VGNRRIKLPKCLRIPQMEDHHFYNRERLLELGKLEFETYAALREAGQLPPRDVMERQRTLLPAELGQEKLELLAEGFGHWSRSQYFHFVKACAKYGREDIAGISNELDMPEEAVAPYAEAFWQYGPTELKDDWERVIGTIERGEKKIAKQKKLSGLLNQFVETFSDPRHEMVFANKGTTHFALEQDRALLTAVNTHGYGNWDSVREEIRRDAGLRFQHAVQGMTAQSIAKRCDYRMRQMERELEAREKSLKMKRPPNVVAAHKAIEAIKEMDFWDMQCRDSELDGEEPLKVESLTGEARSIMEERLKERASAVARLREIEVQVQRCLKVAEDTKKCIYRGDQYVNYSTITLKSGGPAVADKDETTGIALKDSVEIEAKINEAVLKVPVCRQCEACTTSNTRLCARRLEVRNQVMDRETKRLTDRDSPKKKSKKRKAEDPASPLREGGKPVSSSKLSHPTASAAAASSSSTTVAGGSSGKKAGPANDSSGGGEPKPRNRVTSQGNKKMSIPEDLFPEFCRRITAGGTWEREKFAKDFAADHPTVSMRQVSMKLTEVTTRDRPACVEETVKKAGTRAITFYLRPRYYKYLPEDERPPDWERYAAADEALAATEAKQAAAAAAAAAAVPSSTTAGDSNDADSGPPPAKKAKVQGTAKAPPVVTAAGE